MDIGGEGESKEKNGKQNNVYLIKVFILPDRHLTGLAETLKKYIKRNWQSRWETNNCHLYNLLIFSLIIKIIYLFVLIYWISLINREKKKKLANKNKQIYCYLWL